MESAEQDIAYWRQRVVWEQAAAKSAADARVRHVHEVMAMRYQGWIDRASIEESRAA